MIGDVFLTINGEELPSAVTSDVTAIVSYSQHNDVNCPGDFPYDEKFTTIYNLEGEITGGGREYNGANAASWTFMGLSFAGTFERPGLPSLTYVGSAASETTITGSGTLSFLELGYFLENNPLPPEVAEAIHRLWMMLEPHYDIQMTWTGSGTITGESSFNERSC